MRALADDVVDTLRALRCADALRQRGTVQKTSGGYEVFISQQTGCAVYALRLGHDQLYMLEVDDRHAAGEANIAATQLDQTGNLRVSFQRGAFATQEALARAVACTALIVHDVQVDVIESFRRPVEEPAPSGLKPAASIETWLESTDDNPLFVDLVRSALCAAGGAAAAHIDIVPSLRHAPEREYRRYLAAAPVDWEVEQRRELLARMARSGCKVADIDPLAAFRHVRLTRISAGETLVEAGAQASMVYVPLGDGLMVLPLGGYAPFPVRAWMPVGATGVIRGALRNGTVIAEQEVVVLMIPRDVYLRHWHHTYSEQELRQRLGAAAS